MTPLDQAARAVADAVLSVVPGDIDVTPKEAGMIARAVIEAIREPSEEMRIAAAKGRGRPTHAVSRDVWINMIDAILDGPKSSDLTPV